MTDPWPRVPCPPCCEFPPRWHAHYEREPGVYLKLVKPAPCCGREYMRVDELLFGEQCRWRLADKQPMPGASLLVYPKRSPLRPQRRHGGS